MVGMITNAFSELTRAETHFRCDKLDIRLTPNACGKRHARANKRGVSITIQTDVFISCRRCEIGVRNRTALDALGIVSVGSVVRGKNKKPWGGPRIEQQQPINARAKEMPGLFAGQLALHL